MNKKITDYIEERRSDEGYTSINGNSDNIDQADKIGQKFQLNSLEIENKYGEFDDSKSWKVFVMTSLLLNVILILSHI